MVALLLVGAGGAGLLLLAIARPALACAILALAVPVTAGLGRGTVVPVLRVNEVLLLAVVVGVLLGSLRRGGAQPVSGLDLAVLAFCAGSVLIPWAVILISRAPADQQDWMTVLGPVQYLVVFLLYSRVRFPPAALRLLMNVVMLASIPVGLIALAQLLDLGGVRSLVSSYYPTQPLPSWDTVYRPASLLGFYSAVGAFGLLNFLLALALTSVRHPGFSQSWLTLVMAVNLVGLLASETYAPLLALPVGAAAVLLVARRVPWRQAASAPPALAASAILLWPIIGARVQAQLSGSRGSGLSLPESLATRVEYWQGFFLPALLKHGPWLGTGTLIPPEVPRPLVEFVDNGYLWQAFRAGLPGLALQLLLLGVLASVAWRSRSAGDLSLRAVGAVTLGAVASVLLLDTTSEYLTFTAVSQEFWMLAGLLSGMGLAAWSPARFVDASPRRAARWAGLRALPPAGRARRPALSATAVAAAARRLLPEQRLVRSSLAVLAGFGLARLLGFGFQVASGRVLARADYGRLTYALAVAAVSSVLVSTAPLGLSRFLARHADSPVDRDRYYGSWLAATALMLAGAMAAITMAAPGLGLGGWMLAGLLFNLLGVAALEWYREVQRGLGRYALQSAFYVLANAVQLAAVLALAGLGRASPAFFLAAYGLSGVVAFLCFLPLSRGGPRLWAAAFTWSDVRWVLRFLAPLLIQAVFWNLWFSGDLILVAHLSTASATGAYGAAKAIASGFAIIPTAVAFVFAPRVARLQVGEVRAHLVAVLAFTGAVLVPVAAVVAALAGPLTMAVYGARYQDAAAPLAVLTAGMVAYGLKTVFGGVWLGLGHPIVETVSSGTGVVATLAAGLVLIPGLGAVGAAVAFTAGAVVQLLVEAGVTVWALGGPAPRVGHRDEPAPGAARPARRPESPAPPSGPDSASPVLFVDEGVDAPAGEGSRRLANLAAEVAGYRPVVSRLIRARGGHRPSLPILWGFRRLAPAAVVYAARGPVTAPVLLRVRALKLLCRRAPMAVLQLQAGAAPIRRLLRPFAPDLLLVTSEVDLHEARSAGLNAARVTGGDGLLQQLDDVLLLREPGRPLSARLAAVRAAAMRFALAWRRRPVPGGRPVDQWRRPTAVAPAAPAQAVSLPALASPVSDVVGLLDAQPDSALAAAARVAGLRVETAAGEQAIELVERALTERWPLLNVRVDGLDVFGESSLPALAAYLQEGGTLYVDGLRSHCQVSLGRLGRRLGVATPSLADVARLGWLGFPPEQAAFARELAGTRLQIRGGSTALAVRSGWEVLAHRWAGQGPLPVAARHPVGDGGVVLSAAPAAIEGGLADAFLAGSATVMQVALSVLLLRSLYGSAGWHPPATLANFTIDGPALRRGLLGLRWDLLLGQARDHGFHATVATRPLELRLADAAVTSLLRRYPALLSACYLGDGQDARSDGEAAGPQAAQQRALDRAVEQGRRFAVAYGHQLDRVMVLPRRPGRPEALSDLHGLGFIASCDHAGEHPAGSAAAEDPGLGLRPADLAGAGFPLLTRRGVDDDGYLLDLVLGRPALTFADRSALGCDFAPFVEHARAINRASGGVAAWCSLDEVARHAYLQRRRQDGRWEVLMTANEACLHNPAPDPRPVVIHRPHLPSGSFFEVDGGGRMEGAEVTVPPLGTAVVRLVAGGTLPALPGRRRCSIFAPAHHEGPVLA